MSPHHYKCGCIIDDYDPTDTDGVFQAYVRHGPLCRQTNALGIFYCEKKVCLRNFTRIQLSKNCPDFNTGKCPIKASHDPNYLDKQNPIPPQTRAPALPSQTRRPARSARRPTPPTRPQAPPHPPALSSQTTAITPLQQVEMIQASMRYNTNPLMNPPQLPGQTQHTVQSRDYYQPPEQLPYVPPVESPYLTRGRAPPPPRGQQSLPGSFDVSSAMSGLNISAGTASNLPAPSRIGVGRTNSPLTRGRAPTRAPPTSQLSSSRGRASFGSPQPGSTQNFGAISRYSSPGGSSQSPSRGPAQSRPPPGQSSRNSSPAMRARSQSGTRGANALPVHKMSEEEKALAKKKKQATYRKDNADKIKKYAQEHDKTPARRAQNQKNAQKWRDNNKDDPEVRKRAAEAQKRYHEKTKAERKVDPEVRKSRAAAQKKYYEKKKKERDEEERKK
jgi:hypothetical protein